MSNSCWFKRKDLKKIRDGSKVFCKRVEAKVRIVNAGCKNKNCSVNQ